MDRERVPLVAAAYVVCRRGPEVLLQLRAGTGYRDGHWALLAGHVEPDESAFEAAVREAHEEAGVRIAVQDLRPLITLHRFEAGGPAVEQRVDFVFEAVRWTGEPEIREPHRTAAMGWFPLDSLPEPMVPHERVVLDGLRAGDLPAVLAVRTGPDGERYPGPR